MGDGGILPFLVILFVFWVLEGIAKAKRRGQIPEAPPPLEDEGLPGAPRRDRESELLLDLAQSIEARRPPPPVAVPSGWEEGAQREVAPGRLYTALPPARSAGRSTEELRPTAAPAVAWAPTPARALDVPREVRLARPSLRESRLAEASAPRAVRAPVGQLSVRRLSGATPAELRRLIVLQEVLGPPVALRDDPSGRDFD